MRRILTLSLIGWVIFSSCQKETSKAVDTNYHITCKVDGQEASFNVGATAYQIDSLGETIIAIAGADAASTSPKVLSLAIISIEPGAAITAREYTDTSTVYGIGSDYIVQNGIEEYVAGYDLPAIAQQNNVTLANHLKITIKEITDITIRGSFSGDYYLNQDVNANRKTITDGDFYVKIMK